MTRSEKNDFALFCKKASDTQIDGIIAKEREAGRRGYQKIAEREKELREARAEGARRGR